ncbi:hypothetical protein DUZ99_17410 [Xylanibacillus composti]|uniref:Beta-ketoacyl synthase-like N-terminal domain-containing protein n=1 Tax=Xylanibacillus composti TaxID=1572762 RepID=A0A8J4M425_9BACL|nr:beta-ketoacyl synthase N-terminal-like domain-containing protein [Xylanibacillus composti]MDT9726758.1 hypothetical protein [Xylanibacillus composti]GIQ71464.1 hypothetical protein XYCOK13_42880 [Xylanibacillus composti]
MYEMWVEGYGAVTPLGSGAALLLKREELAASPAGLPQLDPSDPHMKPVRKWSSSAQYAYLAVREAISGGKASQPEQAACVVGTNYSNLEAIVSLDRDARQYGVNHANPGIFPETVLNAIGGHLAEKFELRGVNVTLSDGDATGWKLMRYAIDLLQDGRAGEVMVCMVNRFPPEPFRNGGLPCSFRRESVSALRLSCRGSSQGIRLRVDEQAAVNAGHDRQEAIPPWSLPLALVHAALLVDQGVRPYVELVMREQEMLVFGLDKPAMREGADA